MSCESILRGAYVPILVMVLGLAALAITAPAAFAQSATGDTSSLSPLGIRGGFDALDGASDIETVKIGGNTYALVASWADNALQIIDVTDPSSPLPVSSVFDGRGGFDALNGANDIEVVVLSGRTYALVSGWTDSAVQIIDISNPTSPAPTSSVFDGRGGFDALYRASDIEAVTISSRSYALVASWADDAIQVIDVTNPSSPSAVTSIFDGQNGFEALDGANDMEILVTSSSIYALVASLDDDAVQIIDVTDPSSPVPAAAIFDGQNGFDALDGAGDVEIAHISDRTYAMISSIGDDAVQIIDVTDPTSPLPVAAIFDEPEGGSFDSLDGANDVEIVEISGSIYALVASRGDDAVQIIDVTVPAAPIPDTSIIDNQDNFDALDGASDIEVTAISGSTYALVASRGDDAVQIIDITDPSDPVPESAIYDGPGRFDALDGAGDIEIAPILGRTYALVASTVDSSVQVIDITDPDIPLPTVAIFDGQDDFDALEGASDIEIIQISGRTYALVASLEDDAVQIIDLTDPSDPIEIADIFDGQGRFDALYRATDIGLTTAAGQTYALIASMGDDAIQIIDISDPADPLPVTAVFDGQGNFDALDGASGLEIALIQGHTYVLVASSSDDAIQIIDITDPAHPLPVASVFDGQGGFDALDGASDIEVTAISGKIYALVASLEDDAVQIIDITDPANPLPVVALFDGLDDFDALDGASDIEVTAISGSTYALVASLEDDAVQIIDITDPANPQLAADIFDGTNNYAALGGASGIEIIQISGSTYALATSSSDGAVQIIDITDPADPSSVASIFDGQSSFALYSPRLR